MKLRKKGILLLVIAMIIALCLGGGLLISFPKLREKLNPSIADKENIKLDKWEYSQQNYNEKDGIYTSKGSLGISSIESAGVVDSSIVSSANAGLSVSNKYSNSDNYIGYTVGGSQNAKNFRENIKNGYLPISTDITYNGMYSEYYFDTGVVDRKHDEMFYPSYSFAESTNPLSNEKEYYMSVGLNSNIKESDFNRKKVNLVIVLDISGSMSASFNSYYYDGKNNSDNKSKMKIAEECVNDLIDKLNPDDRIGIVLFDDEAYIGMRLSNLNETNTDSLKCHILEVEPQGGTNFSEGYGVGTEFFEEFSKDDSYQNRIVVITDAMPNLGQTSSSQLLKEIEKNANNKIYTSFIGVGVDFNTKFTEEVSDVRGFNYYSVHSSEEFNNILAENFDYMITPLVYDLDLSFESEFYEIENVYGSDSVNKSTGSIMHVNTLFPSASNSEGDVKGGIIVLKLKKIKEVDDAKIILKVSYKDISEKEHKINDDVSFKNVSEDYYDNLGIRKAIVLARYVGTMKNWTLYEKTKRDEFDVNEKNNVAEFLHDDEYVRSILGINERASEKLVVSEKYKDVFKKLKLYMQEENEILKDDTLKDEIEILDKLI